MCEIKTAVYHFQYFGSSTRLTFGIAKTRNSGIIDRSNSGILGFQNSVILGSWLLLILILSFLLTTYFGPRAATHEGVETEISSKNKIVKEKGG